MQRGAAKVNLSNLLPEQKQVWEFWLLLRVSRNSKAQIHFSCTAVSDRRLPGMEALIGEVHFLSLVRCKTRPRRLQSLFRRLIVLAPTLPRPLVTQTSIAPSCLETSDFVPVRLIFRPNSKQVQNNKYSAAQKEIRFILQVKKRPRRAPI